LSLTDDSIIYLRLPDIDFGTITGALVLKGTVSNDADSDPLSVPSDVGSPCESCTSTALTAEAAWLDSCWHCSANDTISVDITAGDAYLQRTSVEYTLTNTVDSWVDATGSTLNFDISGSAIGYDFFSATLPSDSGSKIIVEVTAGAVVTVDIFPKDCAIRSSTPTRTLECPRGFYCEVYTSQANTLYLTGEVRILLTGEDVQGTITVQTGDQLCSSVTADNADFCNGIITTFFGESSTISQKDDYAEYLYNDLVNQFNARLSSTGTCSSGISDTTDANLKKFACQYALPSCKSGYASAGPDYGVCTAIVDDTGVTFSDVNYPFFDCGHNFYPGGVTWVGPGDDDTPPTTPSSIDTSAAPNLLLILLIIPILAIILIIILVVYLLGKGGEENPYQGATTAS
jgi:hypothetical protein